jgi:hypothetical protein
MHISDQQDYRVEYQATCMFLQGEPWYQKATFLRGATGGPRLIAPPLNFMTGYDAEEKQFVEIARQMGFDDGSAKRAHGLAVERQHEFFAALKAEGRRVLADLEAHPIASPSCCSAGPTTPLPTRRTRRVLQVRLRGIEIIPFDFLALEQENFRDIYWEMGQKIIKAGPTRKRHPQLFGCYLTNSLCALDSMMVTHSGPHADQTVAYPRGGLPHGRRGVNTRIEAFLTWCAITSIRDRVRDPATSFAPARTEVDQAGRVTYVDSAGESDSASAARGSRSWSLNGGPFSRSLAAALRGMGWNAEALPVCDREALDLGRAVTTRQGVSADHQHPREIRRYLKHREDPRRS